MKYFIYLLAFLVSCNSPTTTNNEEETAVDSTRIEVESLRAIVMEEHDVSMEKMGEMIKLKSELKEKMKSLDSTEKEPFETAIANLEEADKVMWDWMHGYKAEKVDSSNVEDALEYLDMQKQKIKIVTDKINSSLKNGYVLLEE